MRRTHEQIEKLLLGKRFERLVVTGWEPTNHHRLWVAQCDCGNVIKTRAKTLFSGNAKSCGCYNKDRMTSHGMSRSREYKSYFAMRKRCYDKNNKDYYNYGAKGVTVCKEWLESFEAFFKDMGPRPADHSLDRIDSSKDYTPDNCRWADNSTQAKNRRVVFNFEVNGIMDCLAGHARRHRACTKTVNGLVKTGMSHAQALEEILKRRICGKQ